MAYATGRRGAVREFAEETVKTGIKAARHIFRYLSYHMSR
jgi:hypothetical protein